MEKFTQVSGIAATLMLDNIDTDQIIPGHSMMKLQASGYGDELFYNWRYLPDGSVNKDFVLNQEPYTKASFLVTGQNFGCGSSREWAAWAIRDFGIRAVIAPSFGTIFMRNCYNNGVLPLVIPEEHVENLAKSLNENRNEITIDIESMEIHAPDNSIIKFEVPEIDRDRLIKGLDQIRITLLRDNRVNQYQKCDFVKRPWIYNV